MHLHPISGQSLVTPPSPPCPYRVCLANWDGGVNRLRLILSDTCSTLPVPPSQYLCTPHHINHWSCPLTILPLPRVFSKLRWGSKLIGSHADPQTTSIIQSELTTLPSCSTLSQVRSPSFTVWQKRPITVISD